MLIEARPATDPELVTLIAAQQRELREAVVLDDEAQYLVGVVEGRAIACGGLRAFDADTGEIRRMYVRPAFRGRGLARQLLAALEEMALNAGHTVLRLEVGSHVPEAAALCRSAGYAELPLRVESRIHFEKHILVTA